MSRFVRAALFSAAVFALPLAHAATAAPAPPWPQTTSDIPADPAARFGALPNGMRYVIMHNETPQHVTAIRLRIGAGSRNEADDQQGLAHFLEHMAFKGSTHVAAGEMVKLLQRHGLAFGADTNAFTSFDQTIYQLDLPESDAESIDLGLMLMRETASELTLDPAAMEPERGVVLSEERLRDTPAFEASRQVQAFIMQGQLAPRRNPIGQVQVIRTAPVQRLRDFYEAYYRPERATLVVVGDVDVDVMEAKIRARFGDWAPKGEGAPDPDLGKVAPRGLSAKVVTQPGALLSASIAWTQAYDAGPDTRARVQRRQIESLGLAIINRRLEQLAKSDAPPFLSAAVSRGDTLKSLHSASLLVTPKGDDWRGALIAAEKARREALEFGVTQAELDFAVTQARNRYRNAATDLKSRRSPILASQIVAAVNANDVVSSPKEEFDIFLDTTRNLKAETVSEHLRALFVGFGPLLTLVSPSEIAGGDQALAQAFDTAETAAVTAPNAVAIKPWPYTDFGKPGEVVERRDVADLGVSFVRFANGVRLTFKHTDFRKNEVDLSFQMPGGLAALPRDRTSPTWAFSSVTAGGLKQMSVTEIDETFNGKNFSASAGYGEQVFTINGRTTQGQIASELQLLTAYITEPGWRAAPYERIRAGIDKALDLVSTTAQGALSHELSFRLHDGDLRFKSPDKARVAADRLEDVRALWEPALSKGPLDIVIVGDISTDAAIAAVAKTAGALPPRGPAPNLEAGLAVRFPAPNATPARLTHQGRADQSIGFIAWPTHDWYADPQEGRVLSLTAQVLANRLIDRVRVAEGATYSPSASSQNSSWLKGYGYVAASVETPPEKLQGFFDDVAAITADLRRAPPSADEMDRARKPRLEQITKGRQTNEYWMGALPGSIDHPDRLDNIRQSISGYQAITAEQIEAAARQYLTDERAYRLTVTPDAGARAVPKP